MLRAGVTFHYTAEGPVGHLAGKRVIVVETRGGFYSEGDGKALDAQEPHLKAMLNHRHHRHHFRPRRTSGDLAGSAHGLARRCGR